MALTLCTDCGTSISQKARTCPKCGTPIKRGSSLLRFIGWCLVLFIGLGVIGAIARKAKPRIASANISAEVAPPQQSVKTVTPKRYAPKEDQTYPFKLVTILSQSAEFGGAQCRLRTEGEGWHKSKFDGVWNAVLRRSFGLNEVSCLLESEDISTIQRIELEAEFHQPGLHEAAMLLQFSQSAQILMHPTTPPKEFAEAVANKGEWSNDQWEVKREPYANGGFGLMLRRIAD